MTAKASCFYWTATEGSTARAGTSASTPLLARKCRDCPESFNCADPKRRRKLCGECRKASRRLNHRIQMQRWWSRQSPASRSAIYKRQWQEQRRRLNRLPAEVQRVVYALGNLRRRISEKQNRRSA